MRTAVSMRGCAPQTPRELKNLSAQARTGSSAWIQLGGLAGLVVSSRLRGLVPGRIAGFVRHDHRRRRGHHQHRAGDGHRLRHGRRRSPSPAPSCTPAASKRSGHGADADAPLQARRSLPGGAGSRRPRWPTWTATARMRSSSPARAWWWCGTPTAPPSGATTPCRIASGRAPSSPTSPATPGWRSRSPRAIRSSSSTPRGTWSPASPSPGTARCAASPPPTWTATASSSSSPPPACRAPPT